MKYFTLFSLISSILYGKTIADCFSTKLGYPCCSKTNDVIYSDGDGDWGIENNNWCGIKSCWSNALGYPCCQNSSVYYSDNDGEWGIENGNWCGIISTSESSSKSNEASQSKASQTTQSSGDMAEIAKAYMEKLHIVNPIPADANTKKSEATIQHVTYESTTTGTTRPLSIILPPNYSKDKKYPVLYLLHGIYDDEYSMLNSNTGSVNVPINLAKEGKAKEMILVLPNEYAPAPGTSVSPGFNQDYYDGYDNFVNDLIDNIMPFIESNYSVATGRDNTAIAGFSMGGRNALYIGYTRPDLFGYVAGFSPAPGITPGHDDLLGTHKGLLQESEFKIKEPSKYTPYITIITCNSYDPVVGTFPKAYHELLDKNGQPNIYFEIEGAAHDGSSCIVGLYNLVLAAFGQLN